MRVPGPVRFGDATATDSGSLTEVRIHDSTPMLLRVDVEEGDDYTVVVPRGEVDAATADAVQTAVARALVTRGRILLDFAEVTFVDSTGLRVLVRSHRAAAAAGKLFAVVNLTEQTRKLVTVLGLDQVLNVFDTRADALTADRD